MGVLWEERAEVLGGSGRRGMTLGVWQERNEIWGWLRQGRRFQGAWAGLEQFEGDSSKRKLRL